MKVRVQILAPEHPPTKVSGGIEGVLGSYERLVHPVHTRLQTPDGAGMGETPETRRWRSWMGGWGSAPTRGNFLLKKEKLSRELISLNYFQALQSGLFRFLGLRRCWGLS